MNELLESFVKGVPGEQPIIVVNSSKAYHNLPIAKQVQMSSDFKNVYHADGGAWWLANYEKPLPDVVYFNYDIAFDTEYHQILEQVDIEFGDQIRDMGVVTVSWNDLSTIYLQGIKKRIVGGEELRSDAERIYETAKANGESLTINLNPDDLTKEQSAFDLVLKDSKLNLMAVRPQDILFTYAMDKFNARLTDEGKIVFDIHEADLKPKVGGIYDLPETMKNQGSNLVCN